MQFTPQQLVGAGRYAPVTRIGNWNEDLMLEEARLEEFQLRKQQGSLLATHKLKHDFLHQRAPRAAGRVVHMQDAVGLGHLESHGQLACNVFEETPSIGSGEFVVTVAATASPGASVARTTFRVVSPAAWKRSRACDVRARGEPLRYGEPFFLMCNEALLVDDASVLLKPPLFVKTGLKTERSMSPITYNQRVWLGPGADSAALWVCQRADLAGTDKFLAAGGEVRAGDRVAVVHKMTGTPLYAEAKNRQPTDFGAELEACALAARPAAKQRHLAAEAQGVRTADTEARAHLAPNTWTFELAACDEDARDERALPAFASAASVAGVVRRCLSTESLYAFRRFVVALTRLDARGAGHVSRDEALYFLKPQRLPLRDEHFDGLLAAVDTRHAGHVALRELLGQLRARVSDARAAQIDAAFDRLGGGGGVALALAELVQRYDPTIDARVRAGQLTAEAARAEYRELFITQPEVSRREFAEVYGDVAAAVVNDAHFAQLLAESWT